MWRSGAKRAVKRTLTPAHKKRYIESMRKNFVKFELLVMAGVVKSSPDSYAGAVHQNIQSIDGTGRVISSGAVHTTLARLERKGLLRSRTVGPRRFYELTDAGSQSMDRSVETIQRMVDVIGPAIERRIAEGLM